MVIRTDIYVRKLLERRADDLRRIGEFLFTDATAATLTVIIGVGLLAIAWHLYGQ